MVGAKTISKGIHQIQISFFSEIIMLMHFTLAVLPLLVDFATIDSDLEKTMPKSMH